MIRVIIIDDEKPARELIKAYLKEFNSIEIIAECEDGFTGLKTIQENKPDLVFLDVQMPKLTGFEMLELMEEMPIVIFSTAYDQFALKAFEMNAVDYLLKPYSKERFTDAVNKAIEKIENIPSVRNAEKVKNTINQAVEEISRIVVKSGSKINVLPIDSIIYIEAQDDYVMFYTSDKKYLKKSTMNYYEAHLPKDIFIRIHRSSIVNIAFIDKIELFEKESYSLILKNGVNLKVSKTGYKELKSRLNF
ncbi:MAG: LytTR family transcriptional regulator DNA-binding domain-containing protein [Bacteroidales bacterium]|nr:LytTR family transcriptional regulator DNA-binding domain-containing protein [Bacteroidales bacterium]